MEANGIGDHQHKKIQAGNRSWDQNVSSTQMKKTND